MFERLKYMLIKEFIQIFRDPRMKTIVFITPVMQMILFGYAVNTDVDHVATAVLDLDNSVASRELTSRFEHSGYFDMVTRVSNESQMRQLMDRGRVQAILRFNKGFEANLRAGKKAALQVIVDGTDSNTAGIVLDYSNQITGRYSQELLRKQFSRFVGSRIEPGKVELENRAWFNENLESRLFYVPGVISLLVLVVTVMLTSMAVVREKEIGTMEQIMVTPIRPGEFILGKTLPFALLGFMDVFIISLVAVFWFEVPIRGNPLAMLVSAGLYLMNTLGVGLLISTISRTQQQAMMSAFFYIFPVNLLSGFFFPIANMPEIVQWMTYLNPMRYFVIISRGIFLKGLGFNILWPQMAALLLLGTLTLWLTIKRFKKTLS
ncbi:MAG: ABC transporter permease [Nitrospinaceae bacterium]